MKKKKQNYLQLLLKKIEELLVNLFLLICLVWIGYGAYLLIQKFIVEPVRHMP